MNIYDNTAFPLREHTKKSESEIKRIVMEKLDVTGLIGSEKKLPGEISGGMRKRAGLARALVLDPEILLFDEPDSGLDPVRTAYLNQLIIDLNSQIGATMLIVTHDINTARTVPDNIGLLYRRHLAMFGPAGDAAQLRRAGRAAVPQRQARGPDRHGRGEGRRRARRRDERGSRPCRRSRRSSPPPTARTVRPPARPGRGCARTASPRRPGPTWATATRRSGACRTRTTPYEGDVDEPAQESPYAPPAPAPRRRTGSVTVLEPDAPEVPAAPAPARLAPPVVPLAEAPAQRENVSLDKTTSLDELLAEDDVPAVRIVAAPAHAAPTAPPVQEEALARPRTRRPVAGGRVARRPVAQADAAPAQPAARRSTASTGAAASPDTSAAGKAGKAAAATSGSAAKKAGRTPRRKVGGQ